MQTRCQKCGGRLYLEDGELSCLMCGTVTREAVKPAPSPKTSPGPVPMLTTPGGRLASVEWWPIYRIRFDRHQMRWLIFHLGELQHGRYPPEPGTSSGYSIEIPPGRKEIRYREPAQNKVLELAAEVECRLELVLDYISGWERPTRPARKKRKAKLKTPL